ncbi:MAG: hypothetical protein ACJAVI_001249 [Candidatus Azotimanducaceae bacterium]
MPKEAELVVIGLYPSVMLKKVKAGILHDKIIVWAWTVQVFSVFVGVE